MSSGVYKIVCTENGREYIGSSYNIENRFKIHKQQLNSGKHTNKRLQTDWNVYGYSCFEFVVLELCDKQDLVSKELLHINLSVNKYNITDHINKIDVGYSDTSLFVSKISVLDNGCWTLFDNTKNRYSRITINKTRYRAHRISYYIFNGKFNESLEVCHTCNNKYCCNPSHLFIGTRQDNSKDAANSGLIGNINIDIANDIRNFYNIELSYKDVADYVRAKYDIKISEVSISQVLLNKIFVNNKYIPLIDDRVESKVNLIRNDFLSGCGIRGLSIKYNMNPKTIDSIVKNNTYHNLAYIPRAIKLKKINDCIAGNIKDDYNSGLSISDICLKHCIPRYTISRVIKNQTYRD